MPPKISFDQEPKTWQFSFLDESPKFWEALKLSCKNLLSVDFRENRGKPFYCFTFKDDDRTVSESSNGDLGKYFLPLPLEVIARVLKKIKAEEAEKNEDGVYLSDVSLGDKPWDTHRANADQVKNSYAQVGNHKYSLRIDECAKKLEFVIRQESDNLKRLFRLVNTKFCRVRFCPVCQWRRSLKMFAKLVTAFPKIINDYPKHNFLFLTLTVKNCPVDELRETITKMNKAFVLLTKRKIFPGLGWVKSVEVTRSLDGLAHPHFHIILMVKPSYFSHEYLSKEKWWTLWKDCLKINYDPDVDIRKVKQNEDGILSALCEVLKYSVKEADLLTDPQWLQAITEQLHKTRSISTGGVFKKYLAELEIEPTDDEMINTGLEDEPTEIKEDDPKFWFGWREMVKKYQSE